MSVRPDYGTHMVSSRFSMQRIQCYRDISKCILVDNSYYSLGWVVTAGHATQVIASHDPYTLGQFLYLPPRYFLHLFGSFAGY